MTNKILVNFTFFLVFVSAQLFPNNQRLNIAVSSLDLTLNPFYTYTATEAQYLTGIYEGLVSYHPQNLTPLPALASSWEVSDDKKTYVFTIREDARFSNGDEITAETFKKSFIKLISPETRGEFASLLDIVLGAQEYRLGQNTNPESIGINVSENNELIITLKDRAPYFTKILCHHTFTPVHPILLDKKEWEFEDVISSGPYILKKEANQILFSLNEDYWDKENVGFQEISLIKHKNHQEATYEYNRGKLDWMIGHIDINNLNDRKSLIIHPIFGTTYYFFNSNYKDYSKPKVRRAISQLIPWDKIREKQYIPATSLIPSIDSFKKNTSPFSYNINQALMLLKEEGYPLGKNLPDFIISIPENSENDLEIANIVKASIEEHTDIVVNILTTPYPDFFTINRTIDYTLSTLSWIGDFADPLAFLEMWTSQSNLNDSGFSNLDYDNLIRESTKLDLIERYEELSKAEKLLLDLVIVVPISHSPGVNVLDTSYISNWFPNSLDIHPFKHLRPIKLPRIPGLI